MFRDYSRELGLVRLSGLRLVRLPFGMAVHVRSDFARRKGRITGEEYGIGGECVCILF